LIILIKNICTKIFDNINGSQVIVAATGILNNRAAMM